MAETRPRCKPARAGGWPERYPRAVWSIDEIALAAATGIATADRALRAEQAVRGIDAADELGLHAVIADGLAAAGLGVLREWPLPETTKRRPKATERERCDLVLLPEPGLVLQDPVGRANEADDAGETLFAPVADRLFAEAGVEPSEAFWLEIKTAGQFVVREGVPGPNMRYTTDLVRLPAADIRKLGKQRAVSQAGVMIALFAQSDEVARHDLQVATHRWLDADAPIRSPVIQTVPISDRIGNAVAAVCLVPVRTSFEF